MTKKRCSAVVPAAGIAARMGGRGKIFKPISGMPLIGHTLRALEACAEIVEIILAVRREDLEVMAELVHTLGFDKVTHVIAGGETRPQSVMAALTHTSAEYVAVHDGARPCATPMLISSVLRAAFQYGAAVPGLPVTDSMKSVEDGAVKISVPRNMLYTVQTPQCFETILLRTALAYVLSKGIDVTDDSAAVELLANPIRVVPGDPRNIKITVPDDLPLAAAILAGLSDG